MLTLFGKQALKAEQKDSTQILTFEIFLDLVLKNHPIAKQAELLTDKAKQELRLSRGGFDPNIYSKYYQKEFENKTYYNLWETYLKIPTWFGVEFKTGFELDKGINLNLDNLMPSTGLSYVGLSANVLQGLIIDERRSILRQAQLFPKLAEAEKVKFLNKLLLQAAKEYWEWQLDYKKLIQLNDGYNLANIRYQATIERALQGDLSMIDTVEAAIQAQNIDVLRKQAELEYTNTSLLLSNYMWDNNNTPLEINNKVIPENTQLTITTVSKIELDSLISYAVLNHPELVKLDIKIKQLEIEKRFVTNKMLPKLNIDYGLQQRGFYNQSATSPIQYNIDNFKVAASFYTPIFLRAERGKLQLTKIKLKENYLELKQTNREISNNITAVFNEWLALEKLINIQQKLVLNSETLRNAEQTRFDNGESSLFLVNSRDMTLINNKIKLFELEAKYQKNKNTLTWSAGKLLR
jgi:outer membrane protein TolC